ncbi:MAG TPA: hypothetical protein VEU95_09985 [Micropepsaceae bacterium]|nr:hypothetical protein [Micropepsaceae bacterium]
MTRGICLSTVALVMLAAPAFAQDKCSAPIAPVVPNGRTAAVSDLVQANKDVVAFIKASDDYQSCLLADLQSQIDAAKDNKKELDPAIKKAIEARGDANQKLKETVGKAYNTAAAAYKQAHPK